MIHCAVFVAVVALQKNFPLQKILDKSWEYAKEVQRGFVELGKVWKVYCRVPREYFCGCCRSTVLTGSSCWPSSTATEFLLRKLRPCGRR